MNNALALIVKELQRDISLSPEDYLETGCYEPSIDIRLCIDPGSWVFRVGSSDYDPTHSAICAASCVTMETKPSELLTELIEQCDELETDIVHWGNRYI